MKGHCKDEEGNFFPHLHGVGQYVLWAEAAARKAQIRL